MAANMKAAFTLSLENKLSAGMRKIGQGFEDLRKVGNELGLGKLEHGTDVLRTVGREVQSLTGSLRTVGQGVQSVDGELRTVESAADRAWAALKRMGSVSFAGAVSFGRHVGNVGKQALGQGGLMGAATAVGGAEALIHPSRAYADYENTSRHIAITENLSGPEADAESKRRMRFFNKDALATGQSSESISKAFGELINMGLSPEVVEKNLPTHSMAATAYNMTTEAMGPAVFALLDTFKVGEEGLPGALAAMALASKSGRFKVEDFSRALPGLSSDFAKWGMTGRESANIAFASIETVMRNSADPGTASAAMSSLLNHIASPGTARAFSLESKGLSKETRELVEEYHLPGISIPKLLANARMRHIDPLTSVIAALNKATAGLPPDVQAQALGAYINEKEERLAAQALLQHPREYRDLLTKVRGADASLLMTDYTTAHAAPKITLDTTEEAGKQIERRIGEGFVPVMGALETAGKTLVGWIGDLDQKFPGLADAVLVVTGGMISLGAALAAIGFVAPGVAAGAALAASAVGGAAGVATIGTVGVLLGAGALQGKLNSPYVDEFGRVIAYPGEDPREAHINLRSVPFAIPPAPVTDPASIQPAPVQPGFNVAFPNAETAGSAARNDQPMSLDLTIHTDPGTTVRVNQQSRGGQIRLNLGTTTSRP